MSWLNGHKEVDTTEQLNSKGQTEGKGGKKVMDNVSICTRAATALSALWALSTMQGGRSFSSECSGLEREYSPQHQAPRVDHCLGQLVLP